MTLLQDTVPEAPSFAWRPAEKVAMDRVMGLAVFGEKIAARTYALMGDLRPEYRALMTEFASMEGKHGTWFHEASRRNGFEPDRAFADNELGYLVAQVDDYYSRKDFDALAVLQGFIVECLAISTYEPFIVAAKKYDGLSELFAKVLGEERYHVDWVTRYLRLAFFDRSDEFLALTERVNVQGVDCTGGTLMNITEFLEEIGMSGATCAGGMTDEYTQLLEAVGIAPKQAMRSVVGTFAPLMRKYRHGEKTK
jgi:rubrerythrin